MKFIGNQLIKQIGAFIILLSLAFVLNADVYEEGVINKLIIEGSSKVSVWLTGSNDNNECSDGGRWTLDAKD